MRLLGLAGSAFALVVCVLQPTDANQDACEAGDTCAADGSDGNDPSSLVQLARRGVSGADPSGGNLSSARPHCPRGGYIMVGKFEFVNNCHEDVVLSGWDCVVPAGGSCVVGHSCRGPPAKFTGKKPCSDPAHKTWNPRGGQQGLKWCLASRPSDGCSMIEMNVPFGGEGYCIQRTNGLSHSGMTSSYRFEALLPGTNTPACRDYGMELAIDDATHNGKNWQCPPTTAPLHSPGIPSGCNTYACYCQGQYLPPPRCQVVTPCNMVYDNMWTMLYDTNARRSYRCKGFCAAARHGTGKGVKGCGFKHRAFGPAEVSDYWYSDQGGPHNPKSIASRFTVGGIFGDPTTCKKLNTPVHLRVTSCNIPKTQHSDPACCCGAPEYAGIIGCPARYSTCPMPKHESAEGADAKGA